MGRMGTFLTEKGYDLAGLAHRYFAIPCLAIISIILIHGKINYSRLRIIYLFATYITFACIFQTFEYCQTAKDLKFAYNGGGIGYYITDNILEVYIGPIGTCMFLWAFLILLILLFFGFRNSILFIMRLCSKLSVVSAEEEKIVVRPEPEPKASAKQTQTIKPYKFEEKVEEEPEEEPESEAKTHAFAFLKRLFQIKKDDEPQPQGEEESPKPSTPPTSPKPTNAATSTNTLQETAALFAKARKQQIEQPTAQPAPSAIKPEEVRPTPVVPQPSKAEPEPLVLSGETPQPLKPVNQENAITAPMPALHDNNVNEVVDFEDYGLPSADLLDPIPPAKSGSNNIQASIAAIENVFSQFNLDAKVVNYVQGPVLTQFEIAPKDGVKLDKYRSYESNLLMALRAHSIRIQAPIPGTSVIGIEVPNSIRQSVTLREILESSAWHKAEREMALPLILGKKATGGDLIVDLAELPHLLVAGGTGSGKSVSVNGMLIGLLMCRKPEQLRLIMVDPKRVEFTAYDNLPHLLNPVVVEPKKVLFCLRWAVVEMNRRYKELQTYGARNIGDYNARVANPKTGVKNPTTALPYIVIIIDELADLMLTVKADIEPAITSLTQKARAAGIHLIIATQRPTTDIITGTIKANIPGRVALRVAQSNDSRTIIDATGAENLIGKGDMLFNVPGSTVRSQAPWVSDNEIQRICSFIRDQVGPSFDNFLANTIDKIREEKPADDINSIVSEFVEPEPVNTNLNLGDTDGDDDESLYKQALELIRQTGRFSASALQRRLRVGYNRASRIADMLEERGIIGPSGKAGSTREILVDLNAIAANEIYKGTDAESSIVDTRTHANDEPASPVPQETTPVDASTPITEDDFDLEAFDEQLRASIDVVQPNGDRPL
jgi:S-DNA-T family DNA segregation ATPase FtsK/SpoIIIE